MDPCGTPANKSNKNNNIRYLCLRFFLMEGYNVHFQSPIESSIRKERTLFSCRTLYTVLSPCMHKREITNNPKYEDNIRWEMHV